MNKFLKTLTAVAVVITLIACIGLMVACGDNSNDDQNNGGNSADEYIFKFTVIDEDGNAVEGVMVQLCQGIGICLNPKETDANGVIAFGKADGVSEDVYDIHIIMNGVEGYTFDNDANKTSVDQKDYTLTLTK